jgi:nucleoside-diphosphate-sugar epimerase
MTVTSPDVNVAERASGDPRRRVLITGGAGFVGSQLGQRLAREGHEVILLDNMSFGHLDNLLMSGRPFGRFVCRDIRDPNTHGIYEGVDCVFHLAGIAALPVCQTDPRDAYDVNVAGTGAVLEAARRAGVRRVVFSSTSAVYERTKSALLDEDAPIAPDLVYACTKQSAEVLCRAYAVNYGLDVVICRFFNVFGPHQDVLRASPPFTSYVARELVHDRSPILFNDRTDVRRDYVHVADVVELLLRIMRDEARHAGDVFNVCGGVGHSVPELYELFRRISGKVIDATYRDPAEFWNRYPVLFAQPHPLSRDRVIEEVYKSAVGSNAKVRAAFGWRPALNLEAAVRSVYQDALRRFSLPSEAADHPR